MKNLLATLVVLFTAEAWAQYTVAPFGSGNSSAPPTGVSRKNNCGGSDCQFQINIKPYCYGTNLRAYAVSRQLHPSRPIFMHLNVSDANGKSDKLKIRFPTITTYASKGVTVDCLLDIDQDDSPGYKRIGCHIPWKDAEYKFMLSRWLQNTNPKTSIKGSSDYNLYAGATLPATVHGATSPDVDSNINCYYKFSSNSSTATLVRSSVACYFPSGLPDFGDQVEITKEGSVLPKSEYTVNAFRNNIKIKLKAPLNAIVGSNPVKHGKLVVASPPRHSTSYDQANGGQLATQREIESFDKATGYKSFTAQVKFPGSDGFCGGYYSPLMLFFDNQIPHFTGISLFELYGLKEGTRVHWPEENSSGYFLAHMPKGVSEITSYKQLFSQTDVLANGFDSLALHDANKDGVIDSKDPIFKDLRLWNDKNGDGFSDESEIITLKERAVTSISLKYNSKNPTNFGDRANAREKSTFTFNSKGKSQVGQVFDVWLSPID